MRSFQHRHKRKRRGQALVEAAMVLPVIILFLFGILEYGRYFMMVHECENAVNLGVNYAAKHTSPIVISGGDRQHNLTSAVSPSVVSAAIGSVQLSNPTTTVFMSDSAGNNSGAHGLNAGNGSYVCVQLSGTYNFAITSLTGSAVQMRRVSRFEVVRRSEGN